MLKRMSTPPAQSSAEIKIKDALFPSPFESGLEFNAPARGTWNIVHTGMLIPESRQIFVCAQGCLRGVVLTAAEMNEQGRMSWVAVGENEMFDGTMERQVIDGTADILNKLDSLPPAVLLFLSCIHFFAGCDFKAIINELSRLFPSVTFVECYMNPTMRKSGLTPDEIMRKQLYAPLQKVPFDYKSINIIGNDRASAASCELLKFLKKGGYKIKDITECKTYAEYLSMSESAYNITYLPAAKAAAAELERRLGQKNIYIPLSYSPDEIIENYNKLFSEIQLEQIDFSQYRVSLKQALAHTKRVIGDTAVEIDYTATPRPLSLARLLLESGFNVKKVYADGFYGEEEKDFNLLCRKFPDLIISATVNPNMRFVRGSDEKVLAIGQKAAFFSGSENFVNIVAGGGFYGFDGIEKLADLMSDAFLNKKDTREVIQLKGLGCESCI